MECQDKQLAYQGWRTVVLWPRGVYFLPAQPLLVYSLGAWLYDCPSRRNPFGRLTFEIMRFGWEHAWRIGPLSRDVWPHFLSIEQFTLFPHYPIILENDIDGLPTRSYWGRDLHEDKASLQWRCFWNFNYLVSYRVSSRTLYNLNIFQMAWTRTTDIQMKLNISFWLVENLEGYIVGL